MSRTKLLTDYTYSPTKPASEDAIRSEIDDAIQEVYDASAKNTDTVNLTGNQSIEGIKTFQSSPVIPAATASNHPIRKDKFDTLLSTTDGSSGMDIIGMTPIDGNMTTPQQSLEYLRTRVDATTMSAPTLNVYSVLDFGLKGDGTTNDATQLNNLITVIGSKKATILFTPLTTGQATYLISANVIFPKNIEIKFMNGATLKISNTFSVTGTDTTLSAGIYKIFDLTSGGTLGGIFILEKYYPEWFGAIGDGVTDDTQAIKKAISSLPSIGGEVHFTNENYLYTETLQMPYTSVCKYVRFVGSHRFGTTLTYTGSASPAINAKGLSDSNSRIYIEFKDIGLEYQGVTASIDGIALAYNTPSSNFTNVYVNNFTGSGVTSQDNWNLTFINLRSTNNQQDGFRYVSGALNNMRFIGGTFNANGRYGLYLRGRNFLIDGPSVEGCGFTGIYLEYVYGCAINGIYMEGEGTDSLIFLFVSKGIVINGLNVSAWSGSLTAPLFKARGSSFVLNGFNCETGIGSTLIKDGIAIDIEDCFSYTINNAEINNISKGIKLRNCRGKIENPVFAYVTTPIDAFPHNSIWLDLAIRSDFFSSSVTTLASLEKMKINLIDLPSIGTTAQRPVNPLINGYAYYDTVIDKPIWWDGTQWKDAAGTIV